MEKLARCVHKKMGYKKKFIVRKVYKEIDREIQQEKKRKERRKSSSSDRPPLFHFPSKLSSKRRSRSSSWTSLSKLLSSSSRSSSKRKSSKKKIPKPWYHGSIRKNPPRPDATSLVYNSNILDEDYVKSVTKKCHKQIRERGWIPKELLGRGQYGGAYILCTRKSKEKMDCKYVLKVQVVNDEYFAEIDMLERLKGFEHAAQIVDHWICEEKYAFIIMNRLYICTKKVSRFKISSIVKKMRLKYDIIHVDMHKGNVMGDSKGKIVLIDFGWGAHTSSNLSNHPLVKNGYFRKTPTFKHLEEVQTRNIIKHFT